MGRGMEGGPQAVMEAVAKASRAGEKIIDKPTRLAVH